MTFAVEGLIFTCGIALTGLCCITLLMIYKCKPEFCKPKQKSSPVAMDADGYNGTKRTQTIGTQNSENNANEPGWFDDFDHRMKCVGILACLCCVVMVILAGFSFAWYKTPQSSKYAKWTLALSSNVDIGNDEFNEMFWLTIASDNEENKRYNDYGIFLYICPFCKSPYRRIFYKRLTFAPKINLLDMIKSNWTSDAEHNWLGIDYNLYGSFKDLKDDKNPWQLCLGNVNNQEIGFPGFCIKDGESFKEDQTIIYDNESNELKSKSIKIWVLNRDTLPGIYADDKFTIDFTSLSPTKLPTAVTNTPTTEPTISPTLSPTVNPSVMPTLNPTLLPSISPTDHPSTPPTISPTDMPSVTPTISPSNNPTINPTLSPSIATVVPTVSPSISTINPTGKPSQAPTFTKNPTMIPTLSSQSPSIPPTKTPTESPSLTPTLSPSLIPTKTPSKSPTQAPSPAPTLEPTGIPTQTPTLPTPEPTRRPSISPTIYEQFFPGWGAFRRGWNYVKNEKSGSLILAQKRENFNGFDDTADDCSFSELSFKSSIDGFDSYTKSETQAVEASYGKDKFKVGGAASRTRSEMASSSTSKQHYYYIMNLRCTRADVSLPTFDKVYWDPGFLTELSILPYPFDPNQFSRYQSFFDKYGTHIVQHAQLGGKVEGAISISKCSMHETYSKSSEFEACLNKAYSGGAKSGVCNANGNAEASSSTATNFVGKSSLRVVGGIQNDFGSFINDFKSQRDRGQEFADWIATLKTNPAIIGANLYRFDDAIDNALIIGNHKFNHYGHFPDISKLANISIALTSAYDYYYNSLINTTSTQCTLECNNGAQTGCQCNNCGDTYCCPANSQNESSINKLVIYYAYIISIICLILTQ